jgi:hypothetical protein
MGWLVGFSFEAVSPSYAQRGGASTPDGGTFIEIEDSGTRNCININKYLVSAYVVAVKATQNTSWLPSWIVATKNLGVRVNTTLNSAAQSSPINFPKAKSLRPIGSTDVVTLPLIMQPLQHFDLVDQTKSPPIPIDGVSFDVDFINVEQKGPAATALGELASFTKTLPVPPNPYTSGVQLFSEFANQIIDTAVASDNSANSDDIGSFSYDLAQSDNDCTTDPRSLTEGTTGIIYDYFGSDLTGIIKIADEANYCFKIEPTGSNVSYATKPRSDFNCLDKTQTQTLTFTSLNNPQIVFSFNVIGKPGGGTVTRDAPAGTPDARGITGSAVGQFSQRLAAQLQPGTRDQASLRSNIIRWVEGIQKNQLPIGGSTSTAGGASGHVIDLPADQAREYDAARALLRCARVGIPTQECN